MYLLKGPSAALLTLLLHLRLLTDLLFLLLMGLDACWVVVLLLLLLLTAVLPAPSVCSDRASKLRNGRDVLLRYHSTRSAVSSGCGGYWQGRVAVSPLLTLTATSGPTSRPGTSATTLLLLEGVEGVVGVVPPAHAHTLAAAHSHAHMPAAERKRR